jgi:TrmH family RNA methyltransferase
VTPREVLTSTANPRVKELVGLRRRRSRDATGVTLVEGYAELALALDAGAVPTALYVAPDLVRDEQRALADRVAGLGVAVVEVSAAVMAKVSYRESPDGWVAVVPTPGAALADLDLGTDPLLLVAEAIEKPGNLGAMLRTAEAAGVAALVSAAPVTDFGNPNVVRASKGTVFAVPVASAPTSAVLPWLRDRGVRVVVTTPRGRSTLAEVDLTGALALVIGAESTGVTDPWVEQADATVVIPMYGQVNSLNAATAAAIALYEANRQRRR